MSKIPILKAFEKDTWVKPYLQRYKAPLMLAIFLGFCTFFSAGALMFNSGYLISKSASLPENILLVYVPIVLTRAFGVSRPVFRYIERLTSHNWVLKMTSKLRRKLYHTLEKDAMVFKQKYRMGDILGLLAEDIQYIQNLYLRTIFPLIIALILYAFIVIAVGMFSIFFALYLALLLFILVIVLPVWSVVVNGARQEREKTLKTELYTDLTDNVWPYMLKTAETDSVGRLLCEKYIEFLGTASASYQNDVRVAARICLESLNTRLQEERKRERDARRKLQLENYILKIEDVVKL